jgi:tripartite-type tricarboxylate transporter receptor subunit TctC
MEKRSKIDVGTVILGMVLLLIAMVSAASAQPGEFVKGVLQPLKDGFPNRAITFVNTDEAATKDGIWGRVLQAACKGISPVDIVVSDEPTASWGTFVKLRDVMDRPGGLEGYYTVITTVTGSASDPLVEPILEETGLDLNDLQIAAITEISPVVLVQRKNAPWGRTFDDLKKYALAHPNTLRNGIASVGSASGIGAQYLFRQFGMKIKNVVQMQDEKTIAALGAGEIDVYMGGAATVLPHWEAGRCDVLVVLSKKVPPPWDKDPKIASMTQIGIPFMPNGFIWGMSVPKCVPTSHVNWLFKLFKAAALTDVYKQREKTVPGCQVTIMDPTESNAFKYKCYEAFEPLVRELGLHIDDQKKK